MQGQFRSSDNLSKTTHSKSRGENFGKDKRELFPTCYNPVPGPGSYEPSYPLVKKNSGNVIVGT